MVGVRPKVTTSPSRRNPTRGTRSTCSKRPEMNAGCPGRGSSCQRCGSPNGELGERRAGPRARPGPRTQRRGRRRADRDLLADRNAPRARSDAGRDGDRASGGDPRGDGGEPDDRRGDVSPAGAHEGAPGRVRGSDSSGFPLPRHPSGERLDVVLLGVRRDPVGHQDAGRATGRGAGDPDRGYEQIERMGESSRSSPPGWRNPCTRSSRFDEAEQRAQVAVDATDDLGRAAGQGALARVRAQAGAVRGSGSDGEGGRRVLRATPTTRPTAPGS